MMTNMSDMMLKDYANKNEFSLYFQLGTYIFYNPSLKFNNYYYKSIKT